MKSTICIGNASWVSPRFCRPYMWQGSFERQVNLWMCLGHRRAFHELWRVIQGGPPKSSYKWGEISINNRFKWPKINGFCREITLLIIGFYNSTYKLVFK